MNSESDSLTVTVSACQSEFSMSEESFEAVGVKVDTSKLKSKHFLQTIDSGYHLAPRVRSDGEGSLEVEDLTCFLLIHTSFII